MHDKIFVKGAREHNLKNVDVDHPPGQADCVHGPVRFGQDPPWPLIPSMPRGSAAMWKSLSSYARQFLGQMEKPDVDYIEGLSPAISIDQKTTSKNPRSTVGTVTEIYDYLRLLYARIGIPHCPNCGREIKQQTIDQIVDQVMSSAGGHQDSDPGAGGPRRARANTSKSLGGRAQKRLCPGAGRRQPVRPVRRDQAGKKQKAQHRNCGGPSGRPAEDIQCRLTDSVETAASLSGGLVIVDVIGRGGNALFPELRLSGSRHQHRGADAPDVLLQQPLWRLPEVHRSGHLY